MRRPYSIPIYREARKPRSLIQVKRVYLLTMCQHQTQLLIYTVFSEPHINPTESGYYYYLRLADGPQRVK